MMDAIIPRTDVYQKDQTLEAHGLASRTADDVIRNPHDYGIPDIISARVATGGVVHYVWELETEKGKLYLKIRGNRFARIPDIATAPSNILYEYRALVVLGNLMPDNFPQVVCFDLDKALLVMTDAMPDGASLERLLRDREVTREMLEDFGRTMREIHSSARMISGSIREDAAEEFYIEKLDHKLGYRNSPVLNDVINEMAFHQPRQIIIGDPSPKNIGVNSDGKGFIFFDLEDVHRGNVVFDIGFLIGHLILHTHYDSRQGAAYVEGFLDGYGGKHLGNRLVKAIALGAIMYRLDSIIPYSIDLSDEERLRMLEAIDRILSVPHLGSIPWRELIHGILKQR